MLYAKLRLSNPSGRTPGEIGEALLEALADAGFDVLGCEVAPELLAISSAERTPDLNPAIENRCAAAFAQYLDRGGEATHAVN